MRRVAIPFDSTYRAARHALPHGHALPDAAWRARHRGLLGVLVAHLPLLAAISMVAGHPPLHSALHVLPIAGMALVAQWLPSRRMASVVVATGLLSCSALLVHITGGLIEAHFHFFVMMTVLAFYEDWAPYGVALVYVLVHHGTAALGLPIAVFNHAGASDGLRAVQWAAIHGAFIFASAVANLMLWRANEMSRVRAATLARSLTPTTLPELRDARAAACHVPGDGHAGGDWLDVVTLPDGRILVTLGDVVGHGPESAGCAARLRYTARAYAEDGWTPARILDRLDRAMTVAKATALVAIIDTDAAELVYARAGHLPPVLRLPCGETRLLEDTGGPVLANLGIQHADRRLPFPAGATLVTCSDGMIERRGESIDTGLARLRDAVGRSSGAPAELAVSLPVTLDTAASGDDVALVAVQSR
jgi:hypothetical protein